MTPDVLGVMAEWGVSAEKAEVLIGLRRFAEPHVIARIKAEHMARRAANPTIEQRLDTLDARITLLEARIP